MKVFISGPMKNDPDHPEKFKKWEDTLKAIGQTVFNPCCMMFDESWTRRAKSNIDRAILDECDIVLFLHGWETSEGCMNELDAAIHDNIFILFEDNIIAGKITAQTSDTIARYNTIEMDLLRAVETVLINREED